MFDMIKQMAQMKKIGDEMKKQQVTVEEDGSSLTMRGDFEVIALHLNPERDAAAHERVVMSLLRQAKEKIQGQLASSFKGSLLG